MALSIVPWSLLLLHAQVLQGLERIGDALFLQGVGIPLINIPALLILTRTQGVTGAAMSFLTSTVLVLVIGVVMWRRATPSLGGLKGDFATRTLMESSRPLFLMDFTMVVIGLTDTLLLGVVRDSDAVGVYNAVLRIAVLASSMLDATSVVVAPKFAAMHARGDSAALGGLARGAAKTATLIAVPYVLIVGVAPARVLSLFGPEFRAGAVALVVLALGQLINAATGSVGYLLIMTGHEKLMRNNTLGTSFLKIVLQVLLIPPFGFLGAAFAAAISDSARNLIAMALVWRRLSIFTLPLPDRFVNRYFPGSGASVSGTQR
jgi:O-antigen/teichoic acid export membrane protein